MWIRMGQEENKAKKKTDKRARDAERDKGSKDDRESKGRKQTRLLEDDIKKSETTSPK
jgi:hypothetical protein